jgi:hypothetical protein
VPDAGWTPLHGPGLFDLRLVPERLEFLALVGLILITWTASFLFLMMERT